MTPYKDFHRQWIAGEWCEGHSGTSRANSDPYTDEVLVEIPQASLEDLDAAYRAAQAAQPEWEAKLPSERSAVLERLAGIVEARKDEIVDWLIHESGSTRRKATLEWGLVLGLIKYNIGTTYGLQGSLLPADIPGKEGRAYRKPVGVVGMISPWNWPLQLTARTLIPALALGNAVVVKPASDTPVTGGLLFAKLLEEAGLPTGLVSVVVGRGSEIGDAFVSHPIPRVMSFTGSTPVGRGIARQAADAEIIKHVDLELGGNGPFVVLGDADVDRAVDAAIFGKFLHQGQICMAINRIIVEDSLHDAFVERFVARAERLAVGDPRQEETIIGPIINDKQLDTLKRKIADAQAEGAHMQVGGEAQGRVLPPHVFTGVDQSMSLAREEIFGPIAPILRARDADDAIHMANDTEYGLSTALFTGDVERGVQLARRIEAGMVHVNDQPVNDLPNNPFGGEKNSGLGRFNGDWSVAAFTTDQWVSVQHQPRSYPTDEA